MGYTLSKGFALRCQSITIRLEGVKDPSASTKKKQRTSKGDSWGIKNAGKPSKKDKFAGAKLLFDTVVGDSASSNSHQARNFSGRMPALICDFLVPLLAAGLMEVWGHVGYDVGAINTFVDVPLSLQVVVKEGFLDLTTPGSAAHKQYGATLGEKANDCLLWLQEGETALKALRQQRQKDGEALKAKVQAAVKAPTGADTKITISGGRPVKSEAATVEGEEDWGRRRCTPICRP